MNVRKFTAGSSREAWRQVREELGPDAVILSNRSVNGVVEIMALAPEDMSALAWPVIEEPVVPAAPRPSYSPRRGEPRPAAAVRPAPAAPVMEQASGLSGALAASREQAGAHAAAAEIAAMMNE